VVAEGANGQDAIQLAVEASPDVVIMDLEMPGMNGFEATRQIKGQGSAPRVIILSVHAEREDIARAQAVGADDFVVKGANFQVLIQAILMKTGSPNSSDI
jgi:DNA-binding NarL/FixJ family response regulator